MKYRLLAILVCCALLCSGCRVFFPASQPERPAGSIVSTYAASFENRWCYQRLSAELQDCYAVIYDTLMEKRFVDTVITVSQEDTNRELQEESQMFSGVRIALPHTIEEEGDAKRLYQAITWDNPQFFFLSNDYYYEGYEDAQTDRIVCRSLCLPFTMSAVERRDASAALDAAIVSFMQDLPEGDFERELALHDRLLAGCRYHSDAGDSHDYTRYPNAFTAVGALVEGRAVCEGYSRGLQLLLQRAGLPCTLVTGINEKGDPHMWNMVTVEGRNYHLDPTWDDTEERVRHTFFNLTTEAITRTHTIDADVQGVDSCTATEDNYFRRTNRYINTFERDQIAAVIARDMDAGETAIELQFDPPKFINGQLLCSNKELLTRLIREQQVAPAAQVWDDYGVLVNQDHYTLLLYKK